MGAVSESSRSGQSAGKLQLVASSATIGKMKHFLPRQREAVLLAPMWFTANGKVDCSGHLPLPEALAVLWGWLMRVLRSRANGFVAY